MPWLKLVEQVCSVLANAWLAGDSGSQEKEMCTHTQTHQTWCLACAHKLSLTHASSLWNTQGTEHLKRIMLLVTLHLSWQTGPNEVMSSCSCVWSYFPTQKGFQSSVLFITTGSTTQTNCSCPFYFTVTHLPLHFQTQLRNDFILQTVVFQNVPLSDDIKGFYLFTYATRRIISDVYVASVLVNV